MLGVDGAIAQTETSSTSTHAYTVGDVFMYNGKLYRAVSDISIGGMITPNGNCVETTVDSMFVKFSDYASSDSSGVVKANRNNGIGINGAGALYIDPANGSEIKAGTNQTKAIVSKNLDAATFYGLARAAGD